MLDHETISFILWASALMQLAGATILNFYEGPFIRKVASILLLMVLIFVDTLLVNFPRNSEPVIYANEVMNCTANLAIGGGLLMILGLRDQPRRLV